MRKIILLLLSGLIFFAQVSNAEEAPSQPKSKKSVELAVLLGVDPIPGDALLYAGRKKAGYTVMAMGFGGAGLCVGTFYYLSTLDTKKAHLGEVLLSALIASVGASAYAYSLVIDGVGGIKAVIDHNEKVKEQQKVAFTPIPRPEVSLLSNGGQLSLRWGF